MTGDAPQGGDLAWHGGQLETARRLFPAAPDPWIDLSTGIAPWAYPVGDLPEPLWRRLPEPGELALLESAAADFLGLDDPASVVALPGTDVALRLLARLIKAGRVAIVGHSYSGYRKAWPEAVVTNLADALRADLTICANPNNPDGLCPDRALLNQAENQRIVDEAFADAQPDLSILPFRRGAVVLRSFGKFFGLAGVRLGFAIADPPLAEALRRERGDWPLSGPAIAIGTKAYRDRAWHAAQRNRLNMGSAQLNTLLRTSNLDDGGGTAHFRLCLTERTQELFDHLCHRGILTRIFADRPGTLRLGIPGNEADWERLIEALDSWRLSQ